MASTGATIVGTGASDSSYGSHAWTDAGFITANDASNARVTVSGTTNPTEYLKGTNCGLSVPSGATIDGIEVVIECNDNASFDTIFDRVRIVKADGSIGTTDKSTGASLASTPTTYTFGGASDLWGESWTDTDVNDIDFGVVFSFLANNGSNFIFALVDYISINVYYTEAAGGGAAPRLALLGVGI